MYPIERNIRDDRTNIGSLPFIVVSQGGLDAIIHRWLS